MCPNWLTTECLRSGYRKCMGDEKKCGSVLEIKIMHEKIKKMYEDVIKTATV